MFISILTQKLNTNHLGIQYQEIHALNQTATSFPLTALTLNDCFADPMTCILNVAHSGLELGRINKRKPSSTTYEPEPPGWQTNWQSGTKYIEDCCEAHYLCLIT